VSRPADALVARDPRREAQALLDDARSARVLEPSPPAVAAEPFADDPVGEPPPPGRKAASPLDAEGAGWQRWLEERPGLARWAEARWLAGARRLPPAPAELTATRLALHRVAAYVVSPARRRATGRIGLRWTLGGFGTPFFGDDEQVRVVGDMLVRQRGAVAEAAPLTTLADAAGLALEGPPDTAWAADLRDVPPAGDPEAPLGIDPRASAFLGAWFALAFATLEELRAEAGRERASLVQLWPEHFDAAVDHPAGGGRVTFGLSPGDAPHPEPYAYVLPPHPPEEPDDTWNARGFRGALLPLSRIAGADPRSAVLAFMRARREAIG
jgi:hypothetical protein